MIKWRSGWRAYLAHLQPFGHDGGASESRTEPLELGKDTTAKRSHCERNGFAGTHVVDGVPSCHRQGRAIQLRLQTVLATVLTRTRCKEERRAKEPTAMAMHGCAYSNVNLAVKGSLDERAVDEHPAQD